ncbi:winged helix-turn-helix domain-containing protein [Dactylosporangium sp. NPDC050688]|uniref:winged helix-turn-helix domain-containing protein n=1 Tax=Dactylosporangium sp. NPDC050688 TaxID=3157217 RepID=UPI0033D7AB19
MPELQRVLPKYLQIANYIRDRILRGDLPSGAEVPSERQIAVDWEVARPTAALALEALRNQGFVESRKGSGTFVRQQGQPNRLAPGALFAGSGDRLHLPSERTRRDRRSRRHICSGRRRRRVRDPP